MNWALIRLPRSDVNSGVVFKVRAFSSSQRGPELNPRAGEGWGLFLQWPLSCMDVPQTVLSCAFQAWPRVSAWRENSAQSGQDQALHWLPRCRHCCPSTVMGLRISWRSQYPQILTSRAECGQSLHWGQPPPQILTHMFPRN